MKKHEVSASGQTPVAETRFLVTDLDNTLIDSRERYNRSVAEATGHALPTVPSSVMDIRNLSSDQRNMFYDVFLSSKYMDLDVPVRGSVEVVSKIRSIGIGIIYLTGRHHSKEDSMKIGTVKSLSRLGFPMPNSTDVFLLMKPRKMMSTAKYKRNALGRLVESFELAVGVDDEPDDLQVMTEFIPLTIGLALSPLTSREIKSQISVPIAKDWFEVESILLKNRII